MKNIKNSDFNFQILSVKTDFYQKFLNNGDVVYDLGAFKGVLSVAFAKLGYDVYAVEGSPRNVEDLKLNTQDYKNVKIIQFALNDKNEDYIQTRFNDCLGLDHPLQLISYRTLPSLIKENKLPNPKFIKMDIEGMESVVLNKCDELIEKIRPIWQLSLHDTFEHGVLCVYDNYPGFKKVSQGGFDFNKFIEHNYKVYDLEMNEKKSISGFNEYFLVPIEKL